MNGQLERLCVHVMYYNWLQRLRIQERSITFPIILMQIFPRSKQTKEMKDEGLNSCTKLQHPMKQPSKKK